MRHIRLLVLFVSCLIAEFSAAEEISWYEFSIPWYKAVPAPVGMQHRALDAPAGKHGYVVAEGDRLRFSDGTPARFWGVGITVSNTDMAGGLPPPKKDAAVIADKFASFGFNHVRISGFDGRAPKALYDWLHGGKLESNQLDRLDYFVNELRRRGIYYSLLINNNSHKLFEYADVIRKNEGVKQAARQYSNVRLFDEESTDLMAEWIKAFYSRKNPYTGLTYAEDPANIYMTAVNEDSAYLARFRKGRSVDDYWEKRIDGVFSDYLISKYRDDKGLKAAWTSSLFSGLLPFESLADRSVQLNPIIPVSRISRARSDDTNEFLISVDKSYYLKVVAALRSINYKGLITGTNKWYGYNNLYTNYVTGDYINGHAYFGTVKRSPRIKGQPENSQSITLWNESFINRLVNDTDAVLNDTRFALNRILPAHLIDKPFIVSEWNHMIWSDYAYEGPFILATYAALNGIDGLDLHMMYNPRNGTYKDEYPLEVYSMVGNPLLLSIMPTLSLSYLRGDIEEIVSKHVFCVAGNYKELMDVPDKRPHVPSSLVELFRNSEFGSVRTAMLDGCSITPAEKSGEKSHGAIRVAGDRDGNASLVINTDKYVARIGDLKTANKVGPLDVSLDQQGSVSLISLDGMPLLSSECALLTIAGPTKNTGMKIDYQGDKKNITGTGQWPPLLRGNTGTVSIDTRKGSKYRLVPISIHKGSVDMNINHSDGMISMTLRKQKTPWYILTSNGCDSGRAIAH